MTGIVDITLFLTGEIELGQDWCTHALNPKARNPKSYTRKQCACFAESRKRPGFQTLRRGFRGSGA